MIWRNLFSFLKNYFPVVLILVILAQFHFFRKERAKVADFKQLSEVQQKDIETWRDVAGKNRARADIAEIDAANAKLVLNNELKALLKKEVGNIKRNLISYATVKASTTGNMSAKGRDTVYAIDSIIKPMPAKQFVINNSDLQFNGIYVPSLDSLIADYRVRHNFEVFYYYKKPGKKPWNLFRRKKAVAEIRFENHGSQADSLFTIVLERKKSLWKRIINR